MPTIEALLTYFTNPFPLSILGATLSSYAVLLLFFLKNKKNPKNRSRILTMMFCSSVFLWLFITTSLLLCHFLAESIEYNVPTVKMAAGVAFITSLIMAVPSSIILRSRAPTLLLENIKDKRPPARRVLRRFHTVSYRMKIKAELLQTDNLEKPACIAVGGK